MRVDSVELEVTYNSFGEPTLEAVINKKYRASSPSGISTGSFESKSLDPRVSIRNFKRIKKYLLGKFTQEEFDGVLKRYINALGGSATTALSLSFFHANFKLRSNKFPNFLGNVLGGGKHCFGAGKQCIQEILVMPTSKDLRKSIEISSEIWLRVRNELIKKKALLGLNPEFAWVHKLNDRQALRLAKDVAESYNAKLGIDVAATHFYRRGIYVYNARKLKRKEQIDYIEAIASRFELFYIEDPLEENDFKGFAELNSRLSHVLICGDDLISSNPARFERALNERSVSAVIIKPNQVGTVSDCLRIINLAKKNKIIPVVSHRSKETVCDAVAELSLLAPIAKFSIAGIDIEKRNHLLRLWRNAKRPEIYDVEEIRNLKRCS